jgi:predicted transcriptional regulator
MPAHSLTELQLAVMQVLWSQGEATVLDVQRHLHRPLAQSTVATMLGRMEKRGLVTHRVEGRQFVYSASVTEPDVRRSMIADVSSITDDLFDGDVAAIMSHLLTARDVDQSELARIKALIEAKQRELGGKAP